MQNLTIAIIIIANIITDIIKCSIFLVLINRYVIAAHTEPLTVAHKSIIGKPCSDRINENTDAIITITIYDHIIDLSFT